MFQYPMLIGRLLGTPQSQNATPEDLNRLPASKRIWNLKNGLGKLCVYFGSFHVGVLFWILRWLR